MIAGLSLPYSTADRRQAYYLAGLYPVLLAAGAAAGAGLGPTGCAAERTALLGAALVLSLAAAGMFLPLVPVDRLAASPVVAVNYDAGETVGWPAFAATVGQVRERVPAGERVAVLTRNYGEAGAVDHFLPALGPAYSGHNAYWTWGPPPVEPTALIVVGIPEERVRQWFGLSGSRTRLPPLT